MLFRAVSGGCVARETTSLLVHLGLFWGGGFAPGGRGTTSLVHLGSFLEEVCPWRESLN